MWAPVAALAAVGVWGPFHRTHGHDGVWFLIEICKYLVFNITNANNVSLRFGKMLNEMTFYKFEISHLKAFNIF